MSPFDADVAAEQLLAAEPVTDEDSSSPSVAANTLGSMSNPNTAGAGYDTVDPSILEGVRQRIIRGGALVETPLERLHRIKSSPPKPKAPAGETAFVPRSGPFGSASFEETIRSPFHGEHTLIIGANTSDDFVDDDTAFGGDNRVTCAPLSTPPAIAMAILTSPFAEEDPIPSEGSANLNPTPLLAPDPSATDSSSRNRTGVLARAAALLTNLFQK